MILACHNLKKSFGDRIIVDTGSFHIEEREKAALVGVNGAGKSTIFKMIIGEEPSDGGEIILAKGRSIGYLAQHQNLIPNGTIYEELRSAKADIIEMEQQLRSIEHELQSLSGEELNSRLETYNRLQSQFESQNGYACESEIIGVLKGLGFTEEEFSKKTDTLSGGQKTRVALGKLLLTDPDILLLDEPTNHLDIQSKEILESAMNAYTGTILYVSHDRYFINKTATRILEISDHGLTSYPGNYQDYIAQKEKEKASLTSSTASSVSVDTESKLDWKQQKEEQAKQRKKENRLKKVEEQITELETKQEELSEAMSLPENASDPAKLMELSNEQASIASSLEELYEEWETLC